MLSERTPASEAFLELVFRDPGQAYRRAPRVVNGIGDAGRGFFLLGVASLNVGRLREARTRLSYAAVASKGRPTERARILATFSQVHIREGERNAALDESFAALQLAREATDDEITLGRALYGHGATLRALGHSAEAIEHYERALELLPPNGDRFHYSASVERAVTLAEGGRWIEARADLDAARRMARTGPAAIPEARFLWALAPVWAAAGHPVADAPDLAQALAVAFEQKLEAGDALDAVRLACDLAALWFRAGLPERALSAHFWAKRVADATREGSAAHRVSRALHERARRGALTRAEVEGLRASLDVL